MGWSDHHMSSDLVETLRPTEPFTHPVEKYSRESYYCIRTDSW